MSSQTDSVTHGMSALPNTANPPAQPDRSPKAPFRARLLSNTAWNVGGQVVPLLVGIAVLPLLIRTMGLDRYGFLTLVWVLVGYAGVFDFGIGRALIRVVALRLASGDANGAHHAARVGISFLALFGLAVGALFAFGSAWAVTSAIKLPPDLQGEALQAMWLLAASLPFVMLTTGYAGVLSAHQEFRGLNVVRACMGIATYLGPLVVALWVNGLDAVVAFVVLMRIVATAAHAWLARRSCGFAWMPLVPDRATVIELFSIGGWMSVSNVVGPLLTYLDRLLLAALVPVRMVAFYATPFDLTSKIMIFPYSLMAALFPAAAAVQPGSTAARLMLGQSIRFLFVLMFPFVFLLIALARPGLDMWLGEEFATQAAPVLQVLALGIMLNAVAQGPATLIQAAGKPRTMALLHIAELPVFITLLYTLTLHYGILGTAVAAAARNALDALAVLLLAHRDFGKGQAPWRSSMPPVLLAVGLLAAAFWPSTALQSLMVVLPGLMIFLLIAWYVLILPTERAHLENFIKTAVFSSSPSKSPGA